MSTSTKRRITPDQLPIGILLVDDHPALRAGLRSLLSSEEGLTVLGDVASGEEAYTWYRTRRPDVVVMDLSMAGFGGIECMHRILSFDPRARIIAYSVHTSDTMLNRVLALGGLGYVTKGSPLDVLVHGIREVACYRGFVSPDMISFVVRKRSASDRSLPEQLGNRGFQIFLLTAQGRRVSECAQTLNLSDKTIRNHLTKIKSKLNLADTADLTRLAIRAGLVEP